MTCIFSPKDSIQLKKNALSSTVGAVTLGNFSCNFSHNFVMMQVAPKIAKCNIPRQQLVSQLFAAASVAESTCTVELHSTFHNDWATIYQLFQCCTVQQPLYKLSCNALLHQPIRIPSVLQVAGNPIAQYNRPLFVKLQCCTFKC